MRKPFHMLSLFIIFPLFALTPISHANFLHLIADANSVLIVRVLLALSMLVFASVVDIRNRTVSDRVWIIFGIAGAIIYALDLPTGGEAAIIGISIAFAVGISFAMYRAGLFGGADALGLITLAVILPTFVGSNTWHPIASLTVLSNAALITLVQIPINMIRNLYYSVTQKKGLFEDFEGEGQSRKIVAFLIGYRSVRPTRYAFSIEKGVGNRKMFDFSLKHAETEEFCDRAHAWVTSAMPFLLYIAAGAFTMILVGDLLKVLFIRDLLTPFQTSAFGIIA